MSIVIDGTGTISGLSATGISAVQNVGRANLPAGSVLQVVSASQGTQTNTTSTSYVDTGLSASITPTSSSSKILAIYSAQFRKGTGDISNGVNVILVRGSTQIQKAAGFGGFTNTNIFATWNLASSFLDSPATTSSTTYKVQFSSTISGQNVNYLTDGAEGYITLMEIAA
jgi:hypothetical protein